MVEPEPTVTTVIRANKLIGGGRALAHSDGATWMIRGGLPGELLEVRVTRRRAKIVEADTCRVIEDPHPARVDDPCPHAPGCGGCDWPHVDSDAGAVLKAGAAAEAMTRFPDLARRVANAPITTSPPAYRLRSRLHWDPDRGVAGFYEARSWRVTAIPHCRIISASLSAKLEPLTGALAKHTPGPADIELIEGGNGTIAALRTSRMGPRRIPPDWVPTASECTFFEGFHRLDNSGALRPGWGRDEVRMDLPVPLEVPIGSFFQANLHLVRPLFDRVAELIGPGVEPVFDLHAGVGFLAAAAAHAGRTDLTAVEVNPAAAAAASGNLPGAAVHPTEAESFLAGRTTLPRRAVAITDPPRSGMSRELRTAVAAWAPARIVMLGCDPATWARDSDELLSNGYELVHVELFDLFAFTHHLEILSVLERP